MAIAALIPVSALLASCGGGKEVGKAGSPGESNAGTSSSPKDVVPTDGGAQTSQAKGVVKVPASVAGKLALLKEAARSPKGPKAGCERVRIAKARPYWGPPAPKRVQAHLAGRRLVVRYELGPLPASLACKPYEVFVVPYRGKGSSATFKFYGAPSYVIRTLRERRVITIPRFYGDLPVRVIVATTTVSGLRSNKVVVGVR